MGGQKDPIKYPLTGASSLRDIGGRPGGPFALNGRTLIYGSVATRRNYGYMFFQGPPSSTLGMGPTFKD